MASPRELAALLKPGMPANPALAWHPALTGAEQYGGAMEPAQRPDVAGLVQALGSARDAMGGPIVDRMARHGAQQRQRLASGDYSPTPLTGESIDLADSVAGGLAGNLGFAGIFAGVGAKTANKAALETAQRMASEGADPRAIWRDTGWFQGPEGKWRWEIDDSGAKYPRSIDEKKLKSRQHISDSFNHSALYEAYPSVSELPLRPDYSSPSALALFDEEKGLLGVNASRLAFDGKPKAWRDTTLHELQHAVQASEDFARGGNPGQMAEALRRDADAQLQAIYDEMGDALKIAPQMRSLFERRNSARAMKDWDAVNAIEEEMFKTPEGTRILDLDFKRGEIAEQDFGGDVARSAYRRLAGEAEARAVQKRMDMTPEQRRATFPLDSYDVPIDELIVRQR